MSAPINALPKHSGRVPTEGVYRLVGVSLILSLAFGWLYHFVAQWFDLVILSPMVLGFVIGAILAANVKPARCRNPRLMAILGALSALLAITIRYGFDSADFYRQLPQALVGQMRVEDTGDPITLEQAQQAVQNRLKKIGPLRAFGQFMSIAADAGVTLKDSHSYSKENGTPISGGGFWALLAAETLLAMIVAGAAAAGGVNMPYCERCSQWFEPQPILIAPSTASEQMVAAARSHDWQGLMALKGQPVNDGKVVGWVTVILKRCGTCDDGVLEGTLNTKKKDQTSTKALFAEALTASDVNAIRNSTPTVVS
jgi:hypothetical protein